VTVTELPLDALGPQYQSLEQQHRTATFGMWVFLATELMLFGGLFAAYTIYRTVYPAGFAEGSRHMNLVLGGINTVVLIVSSLTIALAVHSAQHAKRRALVTYLLISAAFGALFIGIKGVEYAQHIADGLAPGVAWHFTGPVPSQVQLFMLAYFAMTGLHAIHLTIAVGLVTVMAIMAARGAFPPENYAPVVSAGLYWHFIDMIWIFLLPLLYFPGLTP
jgi:cytochrome c oxidase subunit 3